MTPFENKNPAHRYTPTWNKIAIDKMKIRIFIQYLTWEPQGAWNPALFDWHLRARKKKREYQPVLWASSFNILLARGHFFLVSVNGFIRGRLARTLGQLETLLGQQENRLVPTYRTGPFFLLFSKRHPQIDWTYCRNQERLPFAWKTR